MFTAWPLLSFPSHLHPSLSKPGTGKWVECSQPVLRDKTDVAAKTPRLKSYDLEWEMSSSSNCTGLWCFTSALRSWAKDRSRTFMGTEHPGEEYCRGQHNPSLWFPQEHTVSSWPRNQRHQWVGNPHRHPKAIAWESHSGSSLWEGF